MDPSPGLQMIRPETSLPRRHAGVLPENAVDRLRDSLERFEIRSSGRTSPDEPPHRDVPHFEIERGRDRAPTPLRSNGADPDFATVLKLQEGEAIIFDSPVLARQRIIPIAGPPVKSKRRHLVLTSRRLFCLKPNLSVKSELILRSTKKSRGTVTTAQLRGEREFTLTTSPLKTYTYAVVYPYSASAWVEKINALVTEETTECRT